MTLFSSIKNNNTDEFYEFLKKNIITNINETDENNNYYLTYAVSNNNYKIVEYLLKNNARIDIVDKENRSILYTIIKLNYIKIFELIFEHNKSSVCKNILFIYDIYNLCSLHYAIMYDNLHILKIIFSNFNNSVKFIFDKNKLLFFSLKFLNFNIVAFLINFVIINSTNSLGNTALHEIIMLNPTNLIDYVELFVKNKIDVNKINNKHKTCAYYIKNDYKVLNFLIKNNLDVTSQDIYGNTLLDNSILSKNYIFIKILMNYDVDQFNLLNIDGNQPLHLLLNNEECDDNIFEIKKIMIKYSDLNIQNNEGNTCLHLLIKTDNWKQFENELINKKLNIYLKNNFGKIPLDYISNFDDNHEIYDIVVKSYINQLVNNENTFIREIDNVFYRILKNNEIKDDDYKKLQKYININNFPKNVNICNIVIKEMLLKKDDEKITSYPITKIDTYDNLYLEQNMNVNLNTFIGTTLDIFFGVLYLLKKYKNSCHAPIFIGKNLIFEIKWFDSKLIIDDKIDLMITTFFNDPKKNMIIPLQINFENKYHSNYLIYSLKTKQIERFEPDGSSTPYDMDYNREKLDNLLHNYFKKFDIGYVSPNKFLPKIGLQRLEIQEKYTFLDENKFCALWCIWYADMRLQHINIERSLFIQLLLSTIKSKKLSFKFIIRSYSEKITDFRDLYFNKINTNINNFINGFVTEKQYDEFHTLLKNEIISL